MKRAILGTVVVAFAAMIAHAGEVAGAKATRLPGVPEVSKIIQMLAKDDEHQRHIAAGFLRLLTAEDGPALEAAWRPGTGALNTEMVRRGYAPAVKFTATYVLNNSNPNQDYFQKLLREVPPNELKPLAKEIYENLKNEKDGPYSFGFVPLAGATGEPGLLGLTMQIFDRQGSRSFLKSLFQTGQSEAALSALRTIAAAGPKDRRLAALAVLPHGWKLAPDAAWTALLKDPDAEIRRAFVFSLGNSTHPAALALAEQALADADPNIVSTAVFAISSFQGVEAVAALQRLAVDKRLSVASRAQLWRSIASRKQQILVKEAREIFLDNTQDRRIRVAVAAHLNNLDKLAVDAGGAPGGEWVLANLSRVDPELQAMMLSEMSGSQSKELLSKIPALIQKLDPKLGAPVLRSLSGRKDPAALDLLVNTLKDTRPEIQTAAQDALLRSTGLAMPRVAASNDPKAPKPNPQLNYTRWQAWYERFGKAPAPELQEQMSKVSAQLRNSRSTPIDAGALGFDPFDALLRLAMDPQHANAATRALGRFADPRVVPAILELCDNELFSSRWPEFSEILEQLPATADGIARMQKKLDSADASSRAQGLRLLAAWRVDAAAARIADEVLAKGAGYELNEKLVAWNNAVVMGKARAILSAPKSDAESRQRAMRLLVAAGQPQDFRLLLQMAQDPKMGDRNVLPAIVSMAMNGNAEAAQGVAGFISSKDINLRQATLRSVNDTMRGDGVKTLELPENIALAVRGLLASPTKETLADVLAILVATGNPANFNALLPDKDKPGVLASLEPEQLSALVSAVIRLRTAAAKPVALALLKGGKVSEPEFAALNNWLRQFGGMTKMETDALAEERKTGKAVQAEKDLGRADDGLMLTANLNVTQIPFDQTQKTETSFNAIVLNTGKVALKMSDEMTVRVRWRSMANPERISYSEARLCLVKTKPTPMKNGFRPLVEIDIAPGKSISATLILNSPPYTPGPAPHQVSFQWQWSASGPVEPRATGRNNSVRGTYESKWAELSLIPDLWLKVDERSQSTK